MASPLTPSFLGKPIEICIVTRSHKRTLSSLCNLGIGPWRIYTCDSSNTTDQFYRGKASEYALLLCFAELPGGMVYEVIEPLVGGAGGNIFEDWLRVKGEGGIDCSPPNPHNRFIAETENMGFSQVHHIAYDCNNIPWEQRIKAFADRGMSVALQGRWNKDCRFAFFEDEDTGTTFETIAFEEGYDYPEPDEWFPAKEGESTEEGKEKEKEKKDD
ncbi:MAG: hypothetical protein Q9164_001668 [Protoblastenia rupestris]